MTTPAARSPNAAYAIARAKAGHPVVPLCAVVAGRCGFPEHCGGSWDATQRRHVAHEGRDIGKAPISALVPHGYKDATASLAKVTTWWLKYPLANVGEPHEANGWVTVDPDTDPAQAEAHKLGLGPTLIRKSRQPAFIYQRPANCPATSVKKRGKSEAIDILADGYLVTFGLHKDGHRIELVGDTVAAAPPWAVEWLQKAAAERETKRSAGVGPGIGDADEPPVLLDEYSLKVWRGELFKAHPDGSVERSGSLVKLGRVLYDAGATRRTVVPALAERDETLGWRKFTGRADAEQQYLAVFAELESKGRNARTPTPSPAAPTPESAEGQAAVEEAERIVSEPDSCLHCPQHCREVTHQQQVIDTQAQVIAAQRAELEQLRGVQAANSERLGDLKRFRQTSTFSGKRKDVVEAIAFEVERARRRGLAEVPIYYGDREKRKNGEDPGGLAGAAGTSPHTVEATVDLLRSAKETPWHFERYLDDNGFRRVKVVFDPESTVERDLAKLAELPRAETVRPEPVRCPDHPSAQLHVTKVCKICGQVAAEYDETPPKVLVASYYKASAPSAPSVDTSPGGGDPLQGPASSKPATRLDDVGFDAVHACDPLGDRDAQRLLLHVLQRGAVLGFPSLRVNGDALQGRKQWERLFDPRMLAYLPRVVEQLDSMEQARAAPPPAHNQEGGQPAYEQ